MICLKKQCLSAGVLYVTADTEVPGSWLNALNVKSPAQAPQSENHGREMSLDHINDRHSIKDRLENIGVPFKRKHLIRIAPKKGSSLHKTFLESKIKAVEDWIKIVGLLKANLVLPELTKVIST